jgi:hypothetical protein
MGAGWGNLPALTLKEEMKVMKAITKKWLHRFGTFCIMGGWILIVLFLLGMTILYYTIFPYSK